MQGTRCCNHTDKEISTRTTNKEISTNIQTVTKITTRQKNQNETKDQPVVISMKEAIQHEDNKTALIVGSIVIGIVALTIYEIY